MAAALLLIPTIPGRVYMVRPGRATTRMRNGHLRGAMGADRTRDNRSRNSGRFRGGTGLGNRANADTCRRSVSETFIWAVDDSGGRSNCLCTFLAKKSHVNPRVYYAWGKDSTRSTSGSWKHSESVPHQTSFTELLNPV
jgi:hypothetical protein